MAGAAKHLVEHWGLRRCTVVDLDLHHGNGTQDILCRGRSPNYQFISLHAHDTFPYTGQPDPALHPYVVNLPLTTPITPAKFRRAWSDMDEAIERFRPECILVSAGFDAHRNDPIGCCSSSSDDDSTSSNAMGRLSAEDYGDAMARLVNLAGRFCASRLVAVMEGGYCLVGHHQQQRQALTAAALAACARGADSTRKAAAAEDGEEDEAAAADDGEEVWAGAEEEDEVSGESLKHCIMASCRAMAGLPHTPPHDQTDRPLPLTDGMMTMMTD